MGFCIQVWLHRSAQCLQAVTITGVNNSQASCLPGFSFCDEEDLTRTSIIAYSVDPYAIDGTPSQVRMGTEREGGGRVLLSR